jgi:hypothetical protein
MEESEEEPMFPRKKPQRNVSKNDDKFSYKIHVQKIEHPDRIGADEGYKRKSKKQHSDSSGEYVDEEPTLHRRKSKSKKRDIDEYVDEDDLEMVAEAVSQALARRDRPISSRPGRTVTKRV